MLASHERDELASCHHGDFQHQNSLVKVKKLLAADCTPSRSWAPRRISIVEIDFVQEGDHFFSGHDSPVKDGGTLEEFVREIILYNRGTTLWCDLKSKTSLCALLSRDPSVRFDSALFLSTLTNICESIKQYQPEKRLYLSCQEPSVYGALVSLNRNCHQSRWTIIEDVPHLNHYIPQFTLLRYIVPKSWTDAYVQNYFLQHPFDASIICIDRSYFSSTEELTQFVTLANIPTGTTLILYNFKLTERCLCIMGYNVIMQYDFTLSL